VVETLFLDAGGVLVFPNWSRVAAALGRYEFHIEPAVLAAAEPRARRRLDVPDIEPLANDRQRGWRYFDLLMAEAGVASDARTRQALADLVPYHAVHNLWEYVPPDVAPALARFRALGLRLVTVSNSNGRVRELLQRVGLADYMTVVVDSAEEGVEKPDPRLFRTALERSGARADTTLHVGDLYYVDVVGARAAGLRAVLLDPNNLYEGVDCLRVESLGELAARLEAGTRHTG